MAKTHANGKKNNSVGKILFILILLLLIFIIIFQNINPASIHFLFWKFDNLPVIAIIIVSLLVGYGIGLLSYNLMFGKKSGIQDKKDQEDSDDTEK